MKGLPKTYAYNTTGKNMKTTKKQITKWIICSLKKGAWAPITVFSIHVLSVFLLNMYTVFPSFDIPMHFLGGVAITYFYIQCITCGIKENILGRPSFLAVILLIFLLTCTTTIFWEFAEWTSDVLFKTHMQVSLNDTLLDMVLGILGGVVMIGTKFTSIAKEK